MVYYGNTKIKNMYFGGTKIRRAFYNGNNVFGSRFMAYDRSKTQSNCFFSDDGITWDSTLGSTNTGNFYVGYGNGLFVSAGDGGIASYSYNGIDWTLLVLEGAGFATSGGVAYGNGRFVNTMTNGLVFYSDNGINWTKVTTDKNFYEIAFANGKFVARSNTEVFYSTDGINWYKSFSGSTIAFICAASNKLFLRNYDTDNGTSVLYSSNDGITWTSFGRVPAGSNLAYGNGKYVIGQLGSIINYSADGTNWTSVTIPINGSDAYSGSYKIYFGNNRFLAIHASGYTAYSSDGVNWGVGQKLSSNLLAIYA